MSDLRQNVLASDSPSAPPAPVRRVRRRLTLAAFALLLPLAATLLPANAAAAPSSSVAAASTPTPTPASRGYSRVPAGVRAVLYVASIKWAARADVRRVRVCESGNNYRSVDAPYYGAYQFLTSTWRAMGGGRFASRADRAPRWAQDYVAYLLYRREGWSPWTCARMVGAR